MLPAMLIAVRTSLVMGRALMFGHRSTHSAKLTTAWCLAGPIVAIIPPLAMDSAVMQRTFWQKSSEHHTMS